MEIQFEHNSLGKRIKSMLAVDFRRMFTSRFFYIMAGNCLVMPVLILVMTTMAGGAPANPRTGMNTTADTFVNTWQIIGSVSTEGASMSMGLTSMCNINMLYFFIAVLVCTFVSDDFRSGYAKNLFTVRAKKTDYVVSKTVVGFVGSALMLLAFFVGGMLGGAIAGLSFDVGTAGMSGVIMCMLSKLLLAAVFVPIYLVMSVAGKQKLWLSMLLSFAAAMFLFNIVPMVSPLDSTVTNVILCLAGGILCSTGIGAVSGQVLKKTSLV